MPETASTQRRSSTIAPAIVSGVALSALLAGCASADTSESDGDDTLRIVLAGEPPTLEACDSTQSPVGVVSRSNITEPLTQLNPTSGELEPLLATSWEATGDTEWTFTLAEGVTFHDGSLFDAEAAAAAIDRSVNTELECHVKGFIFEDQALGLEVVDETTLAITTDTPDPLLPLRLSFLEISNASPDEKVREPVGTGPYAISDWAEGTSLSLSAFGDYWGDAPAFPEVEYQWRDEGSVRAAMVSSGEADLAFGLAASDGAEELGQSFINNETVMLRMDGQMEPFTDIRVRQAVNYAIDREAIAQGLFDGLVTPAGQLVPPGAVGYNDEIQAWSYDPELAAELVEEAAADGVAVDTPIKLIGRIENFPNVEDLAQVLQESMSQIGLNVSLEMMDAATELQYEQQPFVRDEEAIALVMPHGNTAGDASFTVVPYLTSDGVVSYFGDATLDTMIEDAALLEGDERQEAYEDILEYYNEELTGLAVLFHQRGLMAVSEFVSYSPDAQSGDEVRLSQITPAS
ncbi:ABC transporter substrate-binding protein [uncultured Demequina sp.]|uniref:ABC transporter substrate-binding protein n=1 Tax=uncultured Demequina sp. TaxID=693499 RepID=UPI0025E8C7F3|nr:ABC transporter substrate-binding protein [uncultured Demequina sp.]